MLYQLHHAYTQAVAPWHFCISEWRKELSRPWSPWNFTLSGRTLLAMAELFERCTEVYHKPEFGLHETVIDDKAVSVTEEVVLSKPFCNLLHFRRDGHFEHPKVLIVAPMSGHYATLLRGTVEHFLPDHEVYITDWLNARDVPLSKGSFSFDDYVGYLIEFMTKLGPDVHLMAVCQPTVPSIVATAVMAQQDSPFRPKTLSLLGGPIDTRVNPTEVNDYASSKDLEWFEKNVICTVPDAYPGAGQKVYPGFIQLSGFLSMNINSHIQKHFTFFGDLIKGDGDSAENHRKFYNEYLAVMDMPAEFYLDTIRKVFIEHKLPRGTMTYRGEPVDTKAVTDVALLTIEGENDDITGPGQTQAAHDILSGIPEHMHQDYVQAGVGHYGVFNGRRFRQEVGPRIKAFMKKHG